MAHREIFNVRMNVQETKPKMKKEVTALFSLMRQVIETHSENNEAFRVVVVALEDAKDPHLCPHCRPKDPCDVHVSI